MDFSPDTIRSRFHELTAKHDAIEKDLAPLRNELDELVSGEGDITVKEAAKREKALRPKIKALQEKLYPIEMERALCARALSGKTGSPA
jgi:hypothetical protein